MLSIIVPVYRNEENIDRLVQELERIAGIAPLPIEVVLVVDGSPDRSLDLLRRKLPGATFSSRLVSLSRNFGAFNAVRCGLEVASGDYLAVLAADLQEPADLALSFLDILRRDEADIVFAKRSSRDDPWFDELSSRAFWALYRRWVLPELPAGGVNAVGCTRMVRDRLLELREPTTNLIALFFWLGFRRAYVPYDRQKRVHGRSAWTLAKKLRYGFDSLFSFTDVPIRLLLMLGLAGALTAVVFAVLLLSASLAGQITVPGYAPTVLIVTFFGSITSLGLGIVGQYAWLILQTTRGRPGYVIDQSESFRSDRAMTPAAAAGTPAGAPSRR
jgi:glycosyltransferase involved in cell wall biosynthesis